MPHRRARQRQAQRRVRHDPGGAHLAEEVDGTLGLIIRKGPGGRSANAAIPCAPDVFDRVVANADIVITGAADCGSCSAYSVSDTIQLERAGVPTVIVTTTHFERVVDTLAANGGMPSIRKLVLDHPIGGTDRLTLERRAGDATDRLIRLFSGPTPASESLHSNPYLPSVIDLEPLRALVAADGGDLQIDDVDTVAGTVRLRLILPDASCRTCVMPSRGALEHRLRSPIRLDSGPTFGCRARSTGRTDGCERPE